MSEVAAPPPEAGGDISVRAGCLGSESALTAHCYIEADLPMKWRAFARLHESDAVIQRYRTPDSLIDLLSTQ